VFLSHFHCFFFPVEFIFVFNYRVTQFVTSLRIPSGGGSDTSNKKLQIFRLTLVKLSDGSADGVK